MPEQLEELARETRNKNSDLATIQTRQAEQKKRLEQKQTEHKELLTRISLQIDQRRRSVQRLVLGNGLPQVSFRILHAVRVALYRHVRYGALEVVAIDAMLGAIGAGELRETSGR